MYKHARGAKRDLTGKASPTVNGLGVLRDLYQTDYGVPYPLTDDTLVDILCNLGSYKDALDLSDQEVSFVLREMNHRQARIASMDAVRDELDGGG